MKFNKILKNFTGQLILILIAINERKCSADTTPTRTERSSAKANKKNFPKFYSARLKYRHVYIKLYHFPMMTPNDRLNSEKFQNFQARIVIFEGKSEK